MFALTHSWHAIFTDLPSRFHGEGKRRWIFADSLLPSKPGPDGEPPPPPTGGMPAAPTGWYVLSYRPEGEIYTGGTVSGLRIYLEEGMFAGLVCRMAC